MSNLDPDYQQDLEGSTEDQFAEETAQKRNNKKKFKMMCFSCNRPEYHSLRAKRRWLYSYVLGLTFGLMHFIGPFSCSCCGSARLMRKNWLNPRYWIKRRRSLGVATAKKR